MEFSYLLNIVMLSRLVYGFKDQPVSTLKIIITVCMQLLFLLVFEPSMALLFIIIILILLNASTYYFENKLKSLNAFRFISIAAFVIVLSLFTSPEINIKFNKNIYPLFERVKNYSSLLSGIKVRELFNISLLLTGILLLLNEVNFAIRYFFEIFNLFPQSKESVNKTTLDKNEYNAGRVIGMLERILIFFFVISSQYTAIGFVIAAKGFTRFKELDDRKFAEYVLIGTFLSAIFSIAMAVVIKQSL